MSVKAAKCLEKATFNISLLGFNEKLKVVVKSRCECECDNKDITHEYCNNQGKVDCGMCRYGKTFLLLFHLLLFLVVVVVVVAFLFLLGLQLV